MAWESGGRGAAVTEVSQRSGRTLDPVAAASFIAHAAELVDDLDRKDPYLLALDAEPDPVERVDHDRVLEVARVCGDLVDLKSPWLHGHSAAVGDLAGDAAERLGIGGAADVRVAGILHDVGRVGTSARIWSTSRPWTRAERDQARLHPYYTAQVLSRVPALAPLSELAGAHHERCDGSGFHRGLRAAQLPMAARVLAAADAYRNLVEERPHRSAVVPTDAAGQLRAEARAGRLDGDAVAAVNSVATGQVPRRPSGAAGLTARQVEVLRLMTYGLSSRQIGARLSLSPRTVERHVADLYERIGVSSRAAAALFAMEHGLVGPEPPAAPG
jgi:HD-GYP domain-containing protein (c-di-GMP phosphodiesterase class II)